MSTAPRAANVNVSIQGKTPAMHRTMKQVVLLRVGIDAGCGGMQGPLFENGTFEFIALSENVKFVVIFSSGHPPAGCATTHPRPPKVLDVNTHSEYAGELTSDITFCSSWDQ
jgi:hypothetical protein